MFNAISEYHTGIERIKAKVRIKWEFTVYIYRVHHAIFLNILLVNRIGLYWFKLTEMRMFPFHENFFLEQNTQICENDQFEVS